MSNRDDMDEGQGRLRSTVNRTDQSGRRVKGRGFGNTKDEEEDRYGGKFDSMEEDETTGPIRCESYVSVLHFGWKDLHLTETTAVEGWIVFVTGVHEEATEEIIMDKFNEVGITKNLSLPLDRRTGFVKVGPFRNHTVSKRRYTISHHICIHLDSLKGYALIEYEKKEQAEKAIKELNGTELMETTIHVDWAFHGKTEGGSRRGNTSNRGGNNRRFTRK